MHLCLLPSVGRLFYFLDHGDGVTLDEGINTQAVAPTILVNNVVFLLQYCVTPVGDADAVVHKDGVAL